MGVLTGRCPVFGGRGRLVLLVPASLYEAGTMLDDAGGVTGSGTRSQQMAELGSDPGLLRMADGS